MSPATPPDALRALGAHTRACLQCSRSLFRCAEGDRLWDVAKRPPAAAPPAEPIPLGLCHCCQRPVRPGEERLEAVEQGTSASGDVLLHREMCRPAPVRRAPRSPRLVTAAGRT